MVLLPESPEPEEIRHVFILQKGDFVPYFVEHFSARPDQLVVKWEDVNTIDAAEQLKGCEVFLPKKARPKLARGEFYNDEVIGFAVAMSEQLLGTVKAVTETGGNRFLVLDNARETFIPVHGPFIKSINKAKRRILVELPDGFLEL